MRTVRPLITRATTSMTTKVKRCSESDTPNESRGGTKKKSKVATLSTEASTVGPRVARRGHADHAEQVHHDEIRES